MGAKLVKLRRLAARPDQAARRRDANEARLWPFGAALGIGVAAALAGLGGLAWLAWALLHYPRLPRPGLISLHDAVGVLQLVFASVAGAGALVALIVAYRRQKIAEADSVHDRTRVFNERFTAIAGQLGDAQPAVRLAGVHAMAGLADDWLAHRQTCIDVLCAYLRMPYEPDPGEDAPIEKRLAFGASREVRHTVIRVITAHLNGYVAVSWQGMSFDFTGAVFDGGSFTGAVFSGMVSFDAATFSGGQVSFDMAQFSGGMASFGGAMFSGGMVSFGGAMFSGGQVFFDGATFSGGQVSFDGATFSRGAVSFHHATFSGGAVSFHGATFSGGAVSFDVAQFSGGQVSFGGAGFSGGMVSFSYYAKFSGGQVSFGRASFSGGTVVFTYADFSGGQVSFDRATFSGGTVVFTDPASWLLPPVFGPGFDPASPPPGVWLPAAAGPAPDPAAPAG